MTSSSDSLSTHLRALCAHTGNATLVLAASNIEIDLLPPLYDALRTLERTPRMDVVIYLRGGEVNAARRLALLLREFADSLRFLVPHYCESSGTLMALAADEIVAGPLAIFSPIDPHLNAAEGQSGGPGALSAQDIRLFANMSRDWFGYGAEDAATKALPLLCDNIFPTTLTSFYRATLEMEAIGQELQARRSPTGDAEAHAAVVRKLLYDFHSHQFALTGEDMRTLGLPVVRDAALEAIAWDIACDIRRLIGPESRESLQDDWRDALIATPESVRVRRRSRERPSGAWETPEAA